MTVRDYRDLMDLMLDGVEQRRTRTNNPDPDAITVYWAMIEKMMRTLPYNEAEKVMGARVENMESSLDRAEKIVADAKRDGVI